MTSLTLAALARYAVARSLFAPTTLAGALTRFGFVQADPIRAPAVAQDLVLRHRVAGYTARTLEKRYPELAVEEDFFVNYGFVTPEVFALMHPRAPRRAWTRTETRRARALLAFARERGVVHPREVDAHFSHGTVRNWWGGNSSATTHLLDRMHYHGMLRVARREGGVRLYEPRQALPAPMDPDAAMDALVRVIAKKYAPLPEASLRQLIGHMCGGAPQLRAHRRRWTERARRQLASATAGGVRWYWPADEEPSSLGDGVDERVRLLAPFDPVVWDRRRFELFWGWAYRFEAYTPVSKRVRGYYAQPLLWRDRVIGWGNVALSTDGAVTLDVGFAGTRPREKAFARELDAEVERVKAFLASSRTTMGRAT